MAKKFTISAKVVVVIVAATIFITASARSSSPVAAPGLAPTLVPAPGPAGLDCFPYLLNVSDCLSYVEKGSNLTKPEKPCCPEVKTLLETQPICLCELLAHPEQAPLPIDLPKAIGLPSVCKLELPFGTPASGCAALGVPVGAPAPAPASASALGAPAPSSGTTLSPEGLPSTPTSPNNGNDGQSIIAGSQRHFLVGLAVVVFVSFF